MIYKAATRGSRLALAQTQHVCALLAQHFPQHQFEPLVIHTQGDRMLHLPLHQLGGKGVFVQELEAALLSGKADFAVHSMKDVPTQPAEELCFSPAVCRAQPHDALVLRTADSLAALPHGAVIATGSRRRAAQLLALRPDLVITGIRGNLDTRLEKMHRESLDGLVLASAGLHRLGLAHLITHTFSMQEMVCAPAQGALALQTTRKRTDVLEMLCMLGNADDDFCVQVERSFLAATGCGCHAPVGAFCSLSNSTVTLHAMLGSEDATQLVRETICLPASQAMQGAKLLAAQLHHSLQSHSS